MSARAGTPNLNRAPTRRELIEQAIARHGTVPEAAARGGFSRSEVWKVWDAMCQANEVEPPPQTVPACGTAAAYRWHRLRGEQPDPACARAHQAHMAARAQARSVIRRSGRAVVRRRAA